MFWEKIKKNIKNISEAAEEFDYCCSDYEINAKMAKRNYEAYYNDLVQQQTDLIKKWCKEIHEASSEGKKYILTDQFITQDDKDTIVYRLVSHTAYNFPPNCSLTHFQQYFEDRGFKVVRLEYQIGNICALKIIWIPAEDSDKAD